MHPVEKIFKPPFRQVTPFFCVLDSHLPNSADVYVIRATAVKKADAVIGAIVSIRKAQRNLNVADMKTLFVSFAAHQLKTPSSIVKGFLELLLREGRGAFKDEQWNNLASAYEANEQLIGVSKALLNLSKLEGGLIEPVMGEFNPTSALNDKIRSYELQLKAKNISISFVHPHTETFVVTDKSLFVEVFDVILNNAVKYSPVGGQIVITLENTKKELKVSIKDSGPGMSIHEQEELFTKNLSITDYHTGHGLGIMMAKRYLTLLKGVLYVNDNIPKGTVFSFSIPLY